MPNLLPSYQARQLLQDNNLNPDAYDLYDDGSVVPKGQSVTLQPSDSSAAITTPKPSGAWEASKEAFKTGLSYAPAALGGTALGLAAAAPFTGGASAVPAAVFSGAAALLGSLAGTSAQRGVESLAGSTLEQAVRTSSPEEWSQLQATKEQLRTEHPLASALGEASSQIVGMKPSLRTLKEVGGAVKNLPYLGLRSGVALTADQAKALGQVGIGAGMSAGADLAMQGYENFDKNKGIGENLSNIATNLDPYRLLANAAVGGVLTEPNFIGRRLGFKPTEYTGRPVREGYTEVNVPRSLDTVFPEGESTETVPKVQAERTSTPEETAAFKAELAKANEEDKKLNIERLNRVKIAELHQNLQQRSKRTAEEVAAKLAKDRSALESIIRTEKPDWTDEQIQQEINATESAAISKAVETQHVNFNKAIEEIKKASKKGVEIPKEVVEELKVKTDEEIGKELGVKPAEVKPAETITTEPEKVNLQAPKPVFNEEAVNKYVTQDFNPIALEKAAEEIKKTEPQKALDLLEASRRLKEKLYKVEQTTPSVPVVETPVAETPAPVIPKVEPAPSVVPAETPVLKVETPAPIQPKEMRSSSTKEETIPKLETPEPQPLDENARRLIASTGRNVEFNDISSHGKDEPARNVVTLRREDRAPSAGFHEGLHAQVEAAKKMGDNTFLGMVRRAEELVQKGEKILVKKADKSVDEYSLEKMKEVYKDRDLPTQTEETWVYGTGEQMQMLADIRLGREYGNMAKRYWEDLKSMWKYKKNTASLDDISRLLARRQMDFPDYYETALAMKDLERFNKLLVTAPKEQESKPSTEEMRDIPKEMAAGSPPPPKKLPVELTHSGAYAAIDKLTKTSPEAAQIAKNFYDKYREFKGRFGDGPKREITDALFKGDLYHRFTGTGPVVDEFNKAVALNSEGKAPKSFTYDNARKAFDLYKKNIIDIGNTRNDLAKKYGILHYGDVKGEYAPFSLSDGALDILRSGDEKAKEKMQKDFTDYWKKQGAPDPEGEWKEFIGGYSKDSLNLANQFGPLDKAKGYGIPPEYREVDALKNLEKYTDRVARRLAYHDEFQLNDRKGEKLFNNSNISSSDIVRLFKNDINGAGQSAGIVEGLTGVIRTNLMGIGTTARDLATSPWIAATYADYSKVLPAVSKAITELSKSLAESTKAGVNRPDIMAFEYTVNSADGFVKTLRGLSNKLNPRTYVEPYTRALSWGIGKYLAEDVALALKSGRELTKQQKRFIELFGSDPKEATARFVERTQGTYGLMGLPEVAVSGPWKQILSLSRFNIERLNNFKRDVVDQALNGNPTPLFMTLFGTLVGGTIVEQELNKYLSGGKTPKTPTWNEVEQAENSKLLAYKLAAIADAASITGFFGSALKGAADIGMQNNSQGYNDLLLQTGAEVTANVAGVIQAYFEGDADLNTVADAAMNVVKSSSQNLRLLYNLSDEGQKKIERQNKYRDLRVYKQGQNGEDVGFVTPPKDLVQGAERREFKAESDIEKAKQQAVSLAQKAARRVAEGADMKKELAKLQKNSYQTLPSPNENPRKTKEYVDYVRKVQGEEKAQALVADYKRMLRVNDMKEGLVTREFYKELRKLRTRPTN